MKIKLDQLVGQLEKRTKTRLPYPCGNVHLKCFETEVQLCLVKPKKTKKTTNDRSNQNNFNFNNVGYSNGFAI